MDHLERLVITGGGGELFKSCLRDEGNLDVGPCRKLNKSVAQVGLKTMQRAGLCFLLNWETSISKPTACRLVLRPGAE